MTSEEILLDLQERFPLGTRMWKRSGSSWHGKVVGYYSTELTREGLAIESEYEVGSVQIYPVAALEIT
jgi:dihydrofolate reductase (trimethoprim resistance protein)